jgi:hypothetical protein
MFLNEIASKNARIVFLILKLETRVASGHFYLNDRINTSNVFPSIYPLSLFLKKCIFGSPDLLLNDYAWIIFG